jgi:hypothetical protein
VVMVDTPSTQQLRTMVAARLDARLDELVDAVCSAVFAEVSPYQQLALPAALMDFRADVRGSLDAYVRTVGGQGPLTDEDREHFHRIGADRARQGLAADVVTDALEVAMRTCWQYVRAAVLGAGDGNRTAAELLAEVADETFGLFREAAAALMAGHGSERGRGTWGHARATAELVARLVDGTWSDERELRRAARALAVDLDRRWALLLLTPADPRTAGDLERLLPRQAELLPEALIGAPRAVPTGHVPILLPGSEETPPAAPLAELAAVAADLELIVLVPDVTWTWSALAQVYRGHVETIACARAAARGGGVVREADCAVYRLLRALPVSERVSYVRSVLGPMLELPPGKAGEMLATLDAYFRGRGRLDETAADLRLHRNSFRYRLDRAQTILGVNFRNGLDRMRVELALALRRLDKEEAALLEAAAAPEPGAAGARATTVG